MVASTAQNFSPISARGRGKVAEEEEGGRKRMREDEEKEEETEVFQVEKTEVFIFW